MATTLTASHLHQDGNTGLKRKRSDDEESKNAKRSKKEEKPILAETKEGRALNNAIANFINMTPDRLLSLADIETKMDTNVWQRWQVACKNEFDLKHTVALFGERYMFETREGTEFVRLVEEIKPKRRNKAPVKFTEEDASPGLFPPQSLANPKCLPVGKPTSLHSAIFNPYICEFCMVEVSSSKMEEQHLTGKRHLTKKKQVEAGMTLSGMTLFPNDNNNNNKNKKTTNKMNKNNFAPYMCDLCGVNITSQRLEQDHFNGKNHKKKMVQQQRIGPSPGGARVCPPASLATGGKPTLVRLKDGFQQYICQLCDIVISSRKMETAHTSGKRHQRNKTLGGAKVNFVRGGKQAMNNGQNFNYTPF